MSSKKCSVGTASI